MPHEPLSTESFGAVLRQMRTVLTNLNVPTKVHQGLPSGIETWPASRKNASVGELMVNDFLNSQDEINASWQRTKENWVEAGLVHGDIRLANLLSTPSGIAIIDWESYLLGPTEWDDACLFASAILESMLDGPLSAWAVNSLQEISLLSKDFSSQLRDHLIVKLSQSAIDIAASSDEVPMQSAWLIDLALGLGNNEQLDFCHVA
jgi:thiamine kinase-like enzyme